MDLCIRDGEDSDGAASASNPAGHVKTACPYMIQRYSTQICMYTYIYVQIHVYTRLRVHAHKCARGSCCHTVPQIQWYIPPSCQVPQAHWAPSCPLHCSWKQKSCFWLVVKCKLPLQDRFPFLDRPQNPPQEGGQEIEWRRFSVVAKTFDPSCYLVISKKGTPPLFVFPSLSLLPFPLPLPLCFPHFL